MPVSGNRPIFVSERTLREPQLHLAVKRIQIRPHWTRTNLPPSHLTHAYRIPYSKTTATLYYFGGRGLADQVRWMLAYSDVSYTQRVVGTRQRFLDLRSNGQLPFGQLPLLQIDGVEIVQSQAIIRYLARRANLTGTDAREEIGKSRRPTHGCPHA